MPLLRVVTSASPPPAKARELLGDLSRLLARELGKPESYVMTCLLPEQAMTFGGTVAPCCFVEVKSIGHFTPEQTERLSQEVSARIESALDVPKARTYVEFVDATGYLWGHDGGTFA